MIVSAIEYQGIKSAQLHLENELLLMKTLIIKKIVSVFCFMESPALLTMVSPVASGWMVQKDVDSLASIHTPIHPESVRMGWGGVMRNCSNTETDFSPTETIFYRCKYCIT